MLILSRGLQGIGGGGLLPIAQTIIADLLSPRERPIVQGRTSVMFMSASILGPVLGGLLTDHLHWSLIFWINLPLGAVALIMTERALRRLPRNDRPHQLDVIGARVDGRRRDCADAGAGLGRHALSVDLVADRHSDRVLGGAMGAVRDPAFDGARAIYSARDPARPCHLSDHLRALSSRSAPSSASRSIRRSIARPCSAFRRASSGLALIAFMAGYGLWFAGHRAADGADDALFAACRWSGWRSP